MRWLSLRLAVARIRKDLSFSSTVIIAVALAFLSLFALQGVANSRAVAIVSYALNSLPTGSQTITASSSRILSDLKDIVRLSNFLEANRVGIVAGTYTPLVLLHQISDAHGVGFYLGSLDTLERQVRLTSGRFPTSCTSERCEVVQVSSYDQEPQPDALGVVIVGTGKMNDEQLFTGTYSLDARVPLLLSNGIGSLTNLSKSPTLQGTNGWVANLDRKAIAQRGVDSLIQKVVTLENKSALLSSSLSFTWPQDSLSEAGDAGALLRAKINTIGYSIVILNGLFLLLLYSRKRVDHQEFRAGLSRLGTPKSILLKEAIYELGGPLLAGTLLALILAPIFFQFMQLVGIQTTFAQLFDHWNALLFLLLALLSILPVMTFYGDAVWRRRLWIPLATGFMFFVFYLRLSPNNSFSDWKAPVTGALFSIPLSFIFVSFLSRLTHKIDRSAFIFLREESLMWQGVAAVLSFSIFLAVVSLSFNSSVNETITTQMRDRVPLDILIKVGSTLQTPLDLGATSHYEKLLNGSSAYPILRSATTIRTKSSISDSIALLGIPAAALSRINFKASQKLSSGIDHSFETIKGIELGDSTSLTIQLKNIPPEVDLMAWFQTPFGTHVSSIFKGGGDFRSLKLGESIPFGSKLIAFELQESSEYLSRRLHAQGEGDFQVPILVGVGGIIGLSNETGKVPLSQSDWNVSNFRYSFNGNSLSLHPKWQARIPSVITDPLTAQEADNGLLTLSGEGNTSYRVKVISSERSFPSAGDRFIIARLGDLQSTLALQNLGAIDPIELWVTTRDPMQYEAAFMKSKFRELFLDNQRKVGNYLRKNPSNTGLQISYLIALGYAAILALIFLLSALPLMRRQRRDLIFYLESMGETPKSLRKSLRRALLAPLGVGVTVGCSIGLAGSSIYVSSVADLKDVCLMAICIILFADIGTRAYLQRLFDEKSLVEAPNAN